MTFSASFFNNSRVWAFLAGVCVAGWLPANSAAQTNLAVLTTDGAWTWYNDPRAVFHNGALYFGYVRSDGRSALSAFNPQTGAKTDLFTSALSQFDDHNNPALLVKSDGRMLALHARHGSDQFFSYRYSFTTNPVTAANWSAEQTIPNTGAGVTYANPYQLANEGGKIYNHMRDLNFNPTIITSTNGGTNWSLPQLFIQNGGGSIRPYVKYSSDYISRIEYLYTDGHPRNITNSLYHLYYEGGAFYKTDGALVKNLSSLPIQHGSGETGSVIYQYSEAPTNDPNAHIPTGRAWCWEVVRPTNGNPVCLFTVQLDQVTGPNWFDDRIYYYYARWTGTEWQKRFIAQAGRPLYSSEDDYAGGICGDPQNPNVIYISSNAQNPFNLSDTTNVTLRANERYEIFRGTTADGGLTFSWEQITTNSAKDNFRPYIPRHQGGAPPVVVWFRGTYPTFTTYDCEVVGLFNQPVPKPPRVSIVDPTVPLIALTNPANQLKLTATLTEDDGSPQPATLTWSTASGPAGAIFFETNSAGTRAAFPSPGTYVLRVTADDTVSSDFAEVTVLAGPNFSDQPDVSRVLWLKLNETSGANVTDSAGANTGTASGGYVWQPTGGIRDGALEFNGTSAQIVVADANDLDNTTAFTLAYWFNAHAYVVDSSGLVCKRNSASDNNAYTTYLKGPDKRIYVDIDGSNNRFSSATTIQTGRWYHVAVTFDGSLAAAERAKLWLNGALDVTAAESSVSIPNTTSAVRIGNTQGGVSNWFGGRIDDVRFYRRALNATEIAALASTNTAPSVFAGAAPAATNRVAAVLNGSVSDDGNGGPLVAHWNVLSGPGNATFGNSNTPATTVSFNRSGGHVLRLSASDGQAEVSQDLNVAVAPNTNVFEDWIAVFYPGQTNVAIIGPGADPDGDGAGNFGEFSIGLNPASSAPIFPGLPWAEIANFSGTNFLALRVRRPVGRLDVAYAAEVSGDFIGWMAAVSAGAPVNHGDGTETATFRDTQPMSQSARRFIRLRVTKP